MCAGDEVAALGVLDEMRQRGVSPQVVSYTAAIHASGTCGNYQEALNTLNRMIASGTSLLLVLLPLIVLELLVSLLVLRMLLLPPHFQR